MKAKHHSILSAPVIQSGDQKLNNPIRPRWFALALGGFLFFSVCALSPSSVKAECQYDVSGQWTIEQGSYIISVALNQSGKAVSGTASQVHGNTKGGDVGVVHGQVRGTMEGDNFNVQINWSGGGVGVYSGTIVQKNSMLFGTTYDKNRPSSTAQWYTQHQFQCADAAPVGPKPIKSTGHMPAATPKPIKSTGHMPKPTPVSGSGTAGGFIQMHTPAPTPTASAEADESSSNDTEDQHGKHKKNKKKHHHHHDDDENQGND